MKDLFEGCDLKVTGGVLGHLDQHKHAMDPAKSSGLMVLADTGLEDPKMVCSGLDADKLLCSTSESEADSSENEASTSPTSNDSAKVEEVNNNVRLTSTKFDLELDNKMSSDCGGDDLSEEDTPLPEVEKIEVTRYTMTSAQGEVVIEVSGPEQWLCVARLPLDFTEVEFRDLVEHFGSVERTELIHSEKTGHFKGYGLVLYSSKAPSIQARHVLEGQEVRGGHVLDCDWLKFGLVEEVSLHSKCLYIDRLPANYRDMGEFRKLFSNVVNPPYCQIAMKNGVIQNWGLVEFKSSEEAEETLKALNGFDLHGHNIRIQYAIPGVHAITIYMSFINNPLDTQGERKALMEETPSTKVYDQLDSLAKHNPWFVQSLQNIMASTQTDSTKPKIPAAAAAPAMVRPVPTPPAGSDPAQAALILLLAGKVTNPNHTAAQNSALLNRIVKELETGVSAADILKGLVTDEKTEEAEARNGFPPANRPILLQTPPSATTQEGQNKGDLNSIISNLAQTVPKMLNGVVGDQQGEGQGQGQAETKHKKNPQLMEMLFKSYQARVKNGIYNPNQNRNWRPQNNNNNNNSLQHKGHQNDHGKQPIKFPQHSSSSFTATAPRAQFPPPRTYQVTPPQPANFQVPTSLAADLVGTSPAQTTPSMAQMLAQSVYPAAPQAPTKFHPSRHSFQPSHIITPQPPAPTAPQLAPTAAAPPVIPHLNQGANPYLAAYQSAITPDIYSAALAAQQQQMISQQQQQQQQQQQLMWNMAAYPQVQAAPNNGWAQTMTNAQIALPQTQAGAQNMFNPQGLQAYYMAAAAPNKRKFEEAGNSFATSADEVVAKKLKIARENALAASSGAVLMAAGIPH